MTNGWSYRQYSFYRICLGLYLLVHFLYLIPYGTEVFSHQGMLTSSSLSPFIKLFPNIFAFSDSPLTVFLLLSMGALASIFFIWGRADRIASFFLWILLTSLLGRNPFISNPSLPFIGWLLLAHLFIPRKPKESFTPWALPQGIFVAAWIIMALGYTYSGYTKLTSPSWLDGSALYEVLISPIARGNLLTNLLLASPHFLKCLTFATLALELLFAPLACIKRIRPYLWLSLILMHIALTFVLRFVDLSIGMIVLHLFTFNPAWVRAKKSTPIKVLYDGTCGLCHGFVKMILEEMPKGSNQFLFAPLTDSNANSIAVYDSATKTILYKTKAVIAILHRLGGVFRVFAFFLTFIPIKVADFFYDLIARTRHKFFPKPATQCPLVPPQFSSLFKETSA